MYSNGIKASDFIAQVRSETDITPAIPDTSYVRWLTSLEQLLYSEIIREERLVSVSIAEGMIDLSSVAVNDGEKQLAADDVISVFIDGCEIVRAGAAVFYLLSGNTDSFYKKSGEAELEIYAPSGSIEADIVYIVRPSIKSVTDGIISDEYVALPPEFSEMAASKLRGEAYKLANEDVLAAKWLDDFNTQLENFKLWVKNKNQRFGG